MTSLTELDVSCVLNTGVDGIPIEGPGSPLHIEAEDLEYSNAIRPTNIQNESKNLQAAPDELAPETVEEKLAVKSEEIVDLFRTLRAKASSINEQIQKHQVRIDTLNEKLTGLNIATESLSSITCNKGLSDMLLQEFLVKAQTIVNDEIKTIQEKLNVLFVDIAKVKESLSKINQLVFTGVTEALKPEEREQIASGKQCPICIAKPINRALDCGHVLCDGCVAKIGATCHMCRRRYTKVIKLFLDDAAGGEIIATDSPAEVSGFVPNPTIPVAWGSAIGAGQLIGVNTVGASLQSWYH